MELSRAVCVKALKWCKQKYGKSKFQKDYPKLLFWNEYTPEKETLMGEYYWDKNKIVIYKKNHMKFKDPLIEMIFTVIHEYKHYLQNMKKYNMYFDKYYYKYESHPYERTCDKFADREMYECYYFVVNKKKYKKRIKPS
jgi:Zn-dependent peptidase ImmA (M78 family)